MYPICLILDVLTVMIPDSGLVPLSRRKEISNEFSSLLLLLKVEH